MQPFLLFCEEQDCQLQMCAQCSLQHHQGHNLVDIENKASVIKQDLKGMKRDTKEIERIWNLHDGWLKKTTKDINDANEREMKKIEEMRRQLNIMVNEMNRLAVYSYLTRYTYENTGSGRIFTEPLSEKS